jgi:nucleotide-binding universal stress UspA family protein
MSYTRLHAIISWSLTLKREQRKQRAMAGRIVMATGTSDTGYRAVEFAAALSKKFGQALCIVHVLMRGRPAGEITKMVDVEGLAKPARQSGGTDQVADPAAFGGLFPSAEDEVATARMITARGEYIAESAKKRAEEVGRMCDRPLTGLKDAVRREGPRPSKGSTRSKRDWGRGTGANRDCRTG